MALFRVLDPLVRPAAAAAAGREAAESTRLRELEREKQLVLKAIREIEHDFQMRKISEADHQEMSQRYRGPGHAPDPARSTPATTSGP